MSLPRGWAIAELGDLSIKIGSGATPRGGKNTYGRSGTPLIRSMNVHFGGFKKDGLAHLDDAQARALQNVTVKKHDVLLNITGASIGRVCLAPEEMSDARVNQHVCIIRPVEEVLPAYVERFLAAPEMQRQILEENYGVTRQALTKGMIEKFLVPLPPIFEQHRIVARLDVLATRLARARRELDLVPQLAADCRQATLTSAFRGELSDNQREERSWSFEPASKVCAKVQSGGTPKAGFSELEGVPFLKVYNLVQQQIDFDYRPQFVSAEVNMRELKKSIAYPGDVVMNIVGPPLGKVAIIPDKYPQWNLNQALTVFRPSERITSKWIYYYLLGGESVRGIINQTRGIVGQVNISLSQCRDFVLPIPPIAEQIEIIQKIEAAFARADRLESEAARARALLDRLESAILIRTFNGELVPQDPNDEPASVLLDRIDARRAAAPKAKGKAQNGRRLTA